MASTCGFLDPLDTRGQPLVGTARRGIPRRRAGHRAADDRDRRRDRRPGPVLRGAGSATTRSGIRHAAIDLFLDPALHGRRWGEQAVRRVVGLLTVERGHHRITINPAADNASAIRCYEKVGFRRVGVMHRYERDTDGDGWHDGVLMELVITG